MPKAAPKTVSPVNTAEVYRNYINASLLQFATLREGSNAGKIVAGCEASTLGAAAKGAWWMQPIDDAGEIVCGAAVRSDRTGVIVRFRLTETLRTPDNEIAGWEFTVVKADERKANKVIRLVILND